MGNCLRKLKTYNSKTVTKENDEKKNLIKENI